VSDARNVHAQSEAYTTVASPVAIDGAVVNGDIVSYDAATGTCHPSKLPADEMMYGVVVLDPIMYLYDVEADSERTPVVRYGETIVNVSDVAGVIQAGDLVTTSYIAGKGQRIGREEGAYVMGFALEDMEYLDVPPININGAQIRLGTVPVALRIGPFVTKEGASFLASTSVGGLPGRTEQEGNFGFDLFKFFRYILGSLVALAAVIVAARRFGDAFSQGVVSVGRNPLARSQIRAMVLWNALIIVLISSIGLGVGIVIIIAP